MIRQLHDELLSHHACGTKDGNVYSAGDHDSLLPLPARLRAVGASAGRQKKNPPALSVGGFLNLGSLR